MFISEPELIASREAIDSKNIYLFFRIVKVRTYSSETRRSRPDLGEVFKKMEALSGIDVQFIRVNLV